MKQQCFVRIHDEMKRMILALDGLGREQTVDWWYLDGTGYGMASVQFPESAILERFCRWTSTFGIEASLAYVVGGQTRVYLTRREGIDESTRRESDECASILGTCWKQMCEKGLHAYKKRVASVLMFTWLFIDFSRKVSLEASSVGKVADSLIRQLLQFEEEEQETPWERFKPFLYSVAGKTHEGKVKPIVGELEERYQKLDSIVGPVEMSYAMTFLESKYFREA